MMFNSDENNTLSVLTEHLLKKLSTKTDFEDKTLPIQSVNLGESPLKLDITSKNNIIISDIINKDFELFLNNTEQSHRFKLTESLDIISTTGLVGLKWEILAENMLKLKFNTTIY